MVPHAWEFITAVGTNLIFFSSRSSGDQSMAYAQTLIPEAKIFPSYGCQTQYLSFNAMTIMPCESSCQKNYFDDSPRRQRKKKKK